MNPDIQKSILESLLYIQQNPNAIWSEYDMQAIISSYLMKIPEIDPTLIHREYPYMSVSTKKQAHKVDIVIFSEEDTSNINDTHGYLIVWGEDKDGNKTEGKKRAVYCTHLFEIKTKREKYHFKENLLEDFKLLREGYKQYKKANPELFSIAFLYWIPRNKKTQAKFIESIKDLLIEATSPSKIPINFYLLIGPSNSWNEFLSKYLSRFIKNRQILITPKI